MFCVSSGKLTPNLKNPLRTSAPTFTSLANSLVLSPALSPNAMIPVPMLFNGPASSLNLSIGISALCASFIISLLVNSPAAPNLLKSVIALRCMSACLN